MGSTTLNNNAGANQGANDQTKTAERLEAEKVAAAEAEAAAAKEAADKEAEAKSKGDKEKKASVKVAKHDQMKESVGKYLRELDGSEEGEPWKNPHLAVAEGHLNDLHRVVHGVVTA